MKVLLINLPYYRGQEWSLPLGIAYIAAVLLKNGLEVEVVDISLLVIKKQYSPDMLYEKLRKEKYLFIGFGNVFFDFSFFKKLSADIKKICPGIFQIIGGQWASRIADILVNNTEVDAVVMGEGEEVILQIVECLRAGKPVGGLRYVHIKNKQNANEFAVVQDLDKIPFPARELFDIEYQKAEYWGPDPLLGFATILATRGCSRQCLFCSPIGGRVLRTRSPENIILEMNGLNKKYGIKYFRFNDEVFLGSNEKIIDFCDALENSGLKITFSIWSWSENLNKESISRLKNVGCNRIQIGIESGSPQILKEMNKSQNLERVRQKVQLISDHGLLCGSGFLTGTPSESKETLQETKNYIKELYKIRNFTIAQVNFIKFLIGTPIYNIAKQGGAISDDLEFLIDSDRKQMFKFVNITKLREYEYNKTLLDMNKDLTWNYFLTYKMRFIKRLFLADQIDYKNLLRSASWRDIPISIKKFGYVLRGNIRSLFSKIHPLLNINSLKTVFLTGYKGNRYENT